MADGIRIEELKRRVQLDPASIAFAALAEEYRRAGQYEQSIATCQAGLQRHPAYLSARVTLGRSLLELGRYDEAREQLEHVLRAAPENLAAIRGLAEIHHRLGNMPETHGHVSHLPEATAAPGAEPPAPSSVQTAPAAVPVPAPSTAEAEAVEPGREPRLPAPVPAPAKVLLSRFPEPPAPSIGGAASVPAPPADLRQSLTAPAANLPSHPDFAALPALEAMLTAILRARDALDTDRRPGR